jgi:hypothetical protein
MALLVNGRRHRRVTQEKRSPQQGVAPLSPPHAPGPERGRARRGLGAWVLRPWGTAAAHSWPHQSGNSVGARRADDPRPARRGGAEIPLLKPGSRDKRDTPSRPRLLLIPRSKVRILHGPCRNHLLRCCPGLQGASPRGGRSPANWEPAMQTRCKRTVPYGTLRAGTDQEAGAAEAVRGKASRHWTYGMTPPATSLLIPRS